MPRLGYHYKPSRESSDRYRYDWYLKRLLKHNLPLDYQHFMAVYNGGFPEASLYPLGDRMLDNVSFEDVEDVKHYSRGNFLFIGWGGEGVFVMSLGKDTLGSIYFFRRDEPRGRFPTNPRTYLGGKSLDEIIIEKDKPPLLAKSFSEFILNLRKPSRSTRIYPSHFLGEELMKMFIIGLLLGVCLMLLMGAYVPSNDSSVGFALPPDNTAIIRAGNGTIYQLKPTQTVPLQIIGN